MSNTSTNKFLSNIEKCFKETKKTRIYKLNSYYLTPLQIELTKYLSHKNGQNVSELLRDAVDEYLTKNLEVLDNKDLKEINTICMGITSDTLNKFEGKIDGRRREAKINSINTNSM